MGDFRLALQVGKDNLSFIDHRVEWGGPASLGTPRKWRHTTTSTWSLLIGQLNRPALTCGTGTETLRSFFHSEIVTVRTRRKTKRNSRTEPSRIIQRHNGICILCLIGKCKQVSKSSVTCKTRRALDGAHAPPTKLFRRVSEQEAQLSLTNRAMLVCNVIEVWQDFLSEYVDKKFTYICYMGGAVA